MPRKILKQIIEDIKPTKEDEKKVNAKIKKFVEKLNKNLKDAKALLGGSGAKKTWLSDAHDADVFVQFDYKKYKEKSDKLSDILEKILKKTFGKIDRLHGSRDYFQIKQEGFKFEVVPILKINKAENAINITDVSPLHARWVKKFKDVSDEIRLTKQFCRANHIYGAESYIKGFSGYMCEVLTIHYGSFLKLAKAAARWEPKTVIDTMKYYKNKNDVLFNLNKSKQQGPMVLIDPVQKDRNAAAALSEEKYWQFVVACATFIKKPSKEFFELKKMDIKEIKNLADKGENTIILRFESLKGKEDVVGSKLLKTVDFISNRLKKEGFDVKGYSWKWDKEKEGMFWFVLNSKKLSEYEIKQGPPAEMKEHVKKFKKLYKGKTKNVKGKLVAKVKRKYTVPEKFIKKMIKDKYVTEKVKTISYI